MLPARVQTTTDDIGDFSFDAPLLSVSIDVDDLFDSGSENFDSDSSWYDSLDGGSEVVEVEKVTVSLTLQGVFLTYTPQSADFLNLMSTILDILSEESGRHSRPRNPKPTSSPAQHHVSLPVLPMLTTSHI